MSDLFWRITFRWWNARECVNRAWRWLLNRQVQGIPGLDRHGAPRHRCVPDVLLKACLDQFDYALGLVDGTVIRFCEARIEGDWVHLNLGLEPFRGKVHLNGCHEASGKFSFPRDIAVRLDKIVWVCDAPEGS